MIFLLIIISLWFILFQALYQFYQTFKKINQIIKTLPNLKNNFNSFMQRFNDKNKTAYKLYKTFVDKKNNKWVLAILGEQNFLNICCSEIFKQEVKTFLYNEVKETIQNFQIDIQFSFINLKNIKDAPNMIRNI